MSGQAAGTQGEKRYFIDPFGCAKNQVDAELMMDLLNNAGWSAAPDAESADLIIVNSCGFIESAKRESINAVLGWRRLYPGAKIMLAGCLSQRYAKELAESLPEADALFGNGDIGGIVDAAFKATAGAITGGGSTGDTTGGGTRGDFESLPEQRTAPLQKAAAAARPLLSLPGSAYIKISEGCDNRCSFCAIPLIRGGLRCRSVDDILDECRGLLERGVTELCIIGQDIGAFGSGRGGTPSAGLPELLQAIASLEGRFWVRLLYMHPDHFPLRVLDIMERDSRFIPYFDIPFQHASPHILAAMNRRGTAEGYLALLETIRHRLPNAVIRSTVLVGFPGETEDDFAALLAFQEQARPDWLGCFTYSREEGTAAYLMKGRVAAKTAAARKRIVEERQLAITEQNMDRFVGRTLDILIEEQFANAAPDDEAAEDRESLWLGRLYCQAPEVDGTTVIASNSGTDAAGLKPGMMVAGAIIARRGFDLEARVVARN